MYGRRLYDSEVNHLYLPGPRRGLVNWHAAAQGEEVILCESVIDALSLYVAGLTAVLPCYGTQGFTDDHEALFSRQQRVVICFDADAAGQCAAKDLKARLRAGHEVRIVELPEATDVNDLLVSRGPAALLSLVVGAPEPAQPAAAELTAEPAAAPEPEDADTPAADAPEIEPTKTGLVMRTAGLCYEVCGIAKQSTQLKVLLKVSRDDGRSETSTLDLYSWRSREFMAGAFARSLDIDEAQLCDGLKALIEPVERRARDLSGAAGQQSSVATKDTLELTDTEREEALALLERPDLMDQILRDFEAVGYAEEVINKQLGYLVAVSRKLPKPLSLLVEARSSAGKSALQDAILAFVPEEDFLKYSRITDQALFYQDQDALEHKLLVIEEAAGMSGAAYSIRALTSGELRVAAVGTDPVTGKLRTEEYTVKTHTSVMMTNTNPDFDEERPRAVSSCAR